MKENVFNNLWRVYRKANANLMVTVTGNSMFPVICDGDMVNIMPSELYSVGDIVVYKNKTIIIHRIVEAHSNSNGTRFYFSKGDNNLTRDPPLIERCILGKVTKVFREDKTLEINNGIFQRALTNLSILKDSRKKQYIWVRIIEWCQKIVTYFCWLNAKANRKSLKREDKN